MSPELIAVMKDAGISGISLAIFAWLVFKMMQTHKEERGEWRESAERQADKVAKAIEKLADNINHGNEP